MFFWSLKRKKSETIIKCIWGPSPFVHSLKQDMKKEKESSPANNSNGTTQVIDANAKITHESIAIVTIAEKGAFKCRKSNAGTKEQKEKMKASWCYKKTKKGEFQSHDGVKWFPLQPGKKPHNYYGGPKTYNEPETHECYKQIVLNASSVQYYISEDSCPGRSKKERAEWNALSKHERLLRNAQITAYPGTVKSIKIVD